MVGCGKDEKELGGKDGTESLTGVVSSFNFFQTPEEMRAPPATNNELFAILGLSAFIAAAILYFQTPKAIVVAPKVIEKPRPKQPEHERPAHWELGGTTPGWTSGRWLGEGDFSHVGRMKHPFQHQPGYAGHPLQQSELPQAPPVPSGPLGPLGGQTRPMGHRGMEGLMMAPMRFQ